MVIRLIVNGNVRRTRQVVSVKQEPNGVVAIVFLLRLLRHFLFTRFLQGNGPFCVDYRLFLRFFLDSTAGNNVKLRRASVRSVIRLTRSTRLKRFNGTNRRRGTGVEITHLRQTMGVTRRIARGKGVHFLVRRVRREHIVLIGGSCRLSTNLFINARSR